jgi:ABC-type lipoprotein release transport system permease subunit
MFKYLKMAWRNMWRNWRRTLIATVAIVLGLILLVFMDAMIAGSDQAIYSNSVRLYGGNLQVHSPGYRAKASRMPVLPLANAEIVLETVSAQPQVVAASMRINTGGMVSNHRDAVPVAITAIQPEREAPVSLIAENITEGRYLEPADEDAILIGRELADLLGAQVGDRVILLGQRKDESMRQATMTIAGIYDLGLGEAEKGTVFINLSQAQVLYNLRDQATEVTAMLERVGQEDNLVPVLQSALPAYEVDTWDSLRPELQETLAMKSTFTSIFGFIVVMIAAIGIFNLMMMAVYERTREMGVMAAMGMKSRQLLGLFLMEGAMIGIFGAVIGCIAAWILVWAVAQVGIDFSSLTSEMDETVALMGSRLYPAIELSKIIGYGVAVAIIAALATLYPAWQAARQEPAQALHYV